VRGHHVTDLKMMMMLFIGTRFSNLYTAVDTPT
jgi:hypothetical protein